jgi:hypothetical protein
MRRRAIGNRPLVELRTRKDNRRINKESPGWIFANFSLLIDGDEDNSMHRRNAPAATVPA